MNIVKRSQPSVSSVSFWRSFSDVGWSVGMYRATLRIVLEEYKTNKMVVCTSNEEQWIFMVWTAVLTSSPRIANS